MKKKLINKKKVKIRSFLIGDAYNSNYFAWLSDPQVTKYILREELGIGFDKIKIIKYLNDTLENKRIEFFSVFFEKKMIGTLKVSNIDKRSKSGELGIMIGEKNYWNKGLGKYSVDFLINYCFKKIKLNKIFAGTDIRNKGMKKVFISLGFNIVGITKSVFKNKTYKNYKFILNKKNNRKL